ncbi:MAG: PDZ domain-containing protein [Armatimonadetes bacterium]|nr:PDZ domain-containing protein [Armatimonadota bacterium]
MTSLLLATLVGLGQTLLSAQGVPILDLSILNPPIKSEAQGCPGPIWLGSPDDVVEPFSIDLASAQQPRDYAAAWNQVESAIRSRYYARQSRKAEMEALFTKYAPAAKGAKNEGEFSEAVNKMIDDFKDSHFAFLTRSSQGYYNFDSLARSNSAESMPNIGLWYRRDKDGYTVHMVMNGMAAETADIRKGDRMVSVDGKPFSPVDAFRESVGKKVKVVVKRGSAQLEKEVEVASQPAGQMFLEATRNSARIIERDGKKLAYVHLWTMSSEDMKNALSNLVYGRFKDTDGFILDIRDGFGGRPEGFGDPFFRPESTIEWKFGETGGNKQLFGYGRPLVVIINDGSRSAKEVFSHIIKRSKRGTLVGSTTAGHVLGTTPSRASDWAYLEIPIVDVIADGFRIEGVGVSPDVAVAKEYDENGKDLFLERAEEVVLKEIAAKARK